MYLEGHTYKTHDELQCNLKGSLFFEVQSLRWNQEIFIRGTNLENI